jgi:pimeloyl-ACP methyl ester carboxylesterase
LKIRKADIFGFSNGASTTLELAIRHPELINKIVVASTMSKKSGTFPGFWDMMKNTSFAQMPHLLKEGYLKINPDSNALYRMYERDVARMQSFKDIPDDSLRTIKAPAFIIIGEKDVPSPEHAVEMHRLISNSRLVILPGGHGDYIGEITTPQDPVLIKAAVSMIEKFLSEPLPKGD